MAQSLTREDVKTLLDRARESFPHDACLTCECFLGYVAQLGIDAGEDVRAMLAKMGIDRFAEYLRERDQRSQSHNLR